MRLATRGLLDRLFAEASTDERAALDSVRAAAAERGVEAYLVGGSVRDLLLRRPSPDRDVSVVGDAIALARDVGRRLGVRVSAEHEAFGTATLRLGDVNLDLITARREEYPHPGALPVVQPADLAADLTRRDFTINAMALGIAGPRMGALIDDHGGLPDLRAGLVRILHQGSFRDDATRLLRACRYAGRFRFRLEGATETAAGRDRRFLDTISPARLRHELLRTFHEEHPARVLALTEGLGLPAAMLAGLRFGPTVLAAYRRLNPGEHEDGALPWLLPLVGLVAELVEPYVGRFALTHREGRMARSVPRARRELARLAHGSPRPSEIAASLDRFEPPVLRAFALVSPRSGRGALARQYLEALRGVTPGLTSDDLKRLGVPEGPYFGEVRRALRAARLDAPALSLDAERGLVQHMLSERRGV